MRPFLAMTRANLTMSLRNRTALFWNLAFPAIFILIFGAVFGRGQGVAIRVGVAGTESPLRGGTVAALEAGDVFVLSQGTREDELDALARGDRDLVVVFEAATTATGGKPDTAEGSAAAGNVPAVTLAYDAAAGATAQVGLAAVRQILVGLAGGPSPVAIAEVPVQAEEVTFMDAFVPGILAMSLMNSGVIGLATAFVSYRERGILRRIKLTPFPIGRFILARIASQVVIALAQAVVLVGLAWALFGLHVRGNPLVILLAIVVGSLAFLAIGFAISGIARNAETAASYANLVTFPMLFLSGIFFSMENAPAWLRPITNVLPLAYLVDALREPMTRGNGLGAIGLDLLVLAGTFAIALGVAVRFFRWDARAG